MNEGVAREAPTEALLKSQARLQALLSSLDDLVFELDENGTYLEIWTANDALLVVPRSELIGRTHRGRLRPGTPSGWAGGDGAHLAWIHRQTPVR
jgi:PAS domain-containing protein